MKVKDLIKILEIYSPDREVLVDGYEGGYDELSIVDQEVYDKQGEEKESWWDGRYDSSYEARDDTFKALIISR